MSEPQLSYSVKTNYSVKIENSFSFKPNTKNRYSYSVKTNRNTIFKYSDSSISKRIVDLIIPSPICFLITPICLNTTYIILERSLVTFTNLSLINNIEVLVYLYRVAGREGGQGSDPN